MSIEKFSFDGIEISWDESNAFIDESVSAPIITTKENMTEICIQWLALHNPESIKWGEE